MVTGNGSGAVSLDVGAPPAVVGAAVSTAVSARAPPGVPELPQADTARAATAIRVVRDLGIRSSLRSQGAPRPTGSFGSI
jgi:hypothetical protein